MKPGEINPKTLKTILLIIAFILLAAGIFGFYRAYGMISQLVLEKNTAVNKTQQLTTNNPDIADLNDAETKNLAEKANGLIYNAKNLKTQLSTDLYKYANDVGIDIKDISIQSDTLADLPFGGVKSEQVTVTLGSPLHFTNLIKFLKAIETNTPKIQITNIELNNTNVNIGDVAIKPIIMEVYIR
jgi:hypothetical protein